MTEQRTWVRQGVLAVLIAFATPVAAFDTCAVIDIDRVGFERTELAKNVDGARWWVEMGGDLLLCGSPNLIAEARNLGHDIDEIFTDIDAGRIRLIRGETNRREWNDLVQSLLRHRRFEVIHLRQTDDPELALFLRDSRAEPLPLPVTVILQADNSPQKRARQFGESTQGLVDEVDQARWFADLETLASYNRYSYGDGIFDAENWIAQQLSAMPGMTVTTPGFSLGGREVHNVVGTLVGIARPDEWHIVGGHYDSTSEDPQAAAPGAEDNASGCAGVLEMARIFGANPPHASVLFICYVGEEQGLLGSINHASNLVSTGDAGNVHAMLNMDMIGYTSDPDLDCLLESETIGQFLIDAFSAAAATYTTLRIETTLFAWGSDHVPYL
ncbi:MAG: M28 family peptidase, partial [Acidobacteria bacterium]|nr:M28 family peptidase [Acidobacteriota bacterium]